MRACACMISGTSFVRRKSLPSCRHRQTKWMDPRPNRPIVLHSRDVFVDENALCYVTDFNAGLHIVEYKG